METCIKEYWYTSCIEEAFSMCIFFKHSIQKSTGKSKSFNIESYGLRMIFQILKIVALYHERRMALTPLLYFFFEQRMSYYLNTCRYS